MHSKQAGGPNCQLEPDAARRGHSCRGLAARKRFPSQRYLGLPRLRWVGPAATVTLPLTHATRDTQESRGFNPFFDSSAWGVPGRPAPGGGGGPPGAHITAPSQVFRVLAARCRPRTPRAWLGPPIVSRHGPTVLRAESSAPSTLPPPPSQKLFSLLREEQREKSGRDGARIERAAAATADGAVRRGGDAGWDSEPEESEPEHSEPE